MKLYRLLAIIMYLLNRDRVSASELAEHFEVSNRTIYRDLETINQAGIPIVSYQGANGGFGIMENYKIDRHVLALDEITSIIMALQGVSKTMDDLKINGTLEKMKGLLPDREKERMTSNRELIIDFTPWGNFQPQKEKINQIRDGIKSNQLICFTYISAEGQESLRTVEPMTLIWRGPAWYLYGYCRLRKDYRLFKVARIRDLQVETERFIRKEKDVQDYPWSKDWSEQGTEIEILLHFQPKVRARVEEFFLESEIDLQQDGSLLVRVRYPEDEWVYGVILSFGDAVEVLKPVALRGIIRERAKRLVEIYAED